MAVGGLLLALIPRAHADDDPSLLMVGVGTWETLRGNYISPELDVAYRPDLKLLWIIKPHAGFVVAKDGSYNGYVGLLADIHWTNHLVTTLNSAFAGWGGGGYDLGSHFEFRSGIDNAWRFNDGSRLGIGFYHESNAGITRENGGSESLILEYSVPVARLFGR